MLVKNKQYVFERI